MRHDDRDALPEPVPAGRRRRPTDDLPPERRHRIGLGAWVVLALLLFFLSGLAARIIIHVDWSTSSVRNPPSPVRFGGEEPDFRIQRDVEMRDRMMMQRMR